MYGRDIIATKEEQKEYHLVGKQGFAKKVFSLLLIRRKLHQYFADTKTQWMWYEST